MRLGVNIDHVATIRQARQTTEPEPVTAAALAELAGADGITVHLRGDRRHMQDRDLRLLRETVATRLNVEMAATDEMVAIATEIKPHQVTLVPELPGEVTTTGGLDVVQHRDLIADVVRRLQAASDGNELGSSVGPATSSIPPRTWWRARHFLLAPGWGTRSWACHSLSTRRRWSPSMLRPRRRACRTCTNSATQLRGASVR